MSPPPHTNARDALSPASLDRLRKSATAAVKNGDLTVPQACRKYNISVRTFYRWKSDHSSKRGCTTLADRLQCVQDVLSGRLSIAQACQQRRISTRTYYRWLSQKERISDLLDGVGKQDGIPALLDRGDEHSRTLSQENGRRQEQQEQQQQPLVQPATTTTVATTATTTTTTTPTVQQQQQHHHHQPAHHPLPIAPRPPTPPPSQPRKTISIPTPPPLSIPTSQQLVQPLTETNTTKTTTPVNTTNIPSESNPTPPTPPPPPPPQQQQPTSTQTPPQTPPPILPPRARRYLRRPQNNPNPDSHSHSHSHSHSPPPSSEDPSSQPQQPSSHQNPTHHPDPQHQQPKHRIVVTHADAQATIAWYPGTAAADIKAAIARRFALPPGTFFTLRDHLDHVDTLVSEGLPSGNYDLVL